MCEDNSSGLEDEGAARLDRLNITSTSAVHESATPSTARRDLAAWMLEGPGLEGSPASSSSPAVPERVAKQIMPATGRWEFRYGGCQVVTIHDDCMNQSAGGCHPKMSADAALHDMATPEVHKKSAGKRTPFKPFAAAGAPEKKPDPSPSPTSPEETAAAGVQAPKPMAYRPDLDGLRAFAVIPVILYHFNLGDLFGSSVSFGAHSQTHDACTHWAVE